MVDWAMYADLLFYTLLLSLLPIAVLVPPIFIYSMAHVYLYEYGFNEPYTTILSYVVLIWCFALPAFTVVKLIEHIRR